MSDNSSNTIKIELDENGKVTKIVWEESSATRHIIDTEAPPYWELTGAHRICITKGKSPRSAAENDKPPVLMHEPHSQIGITCRSYDVLGIKVTYCW